MPKQVKVNLFGKEGHRQTEVTQRGFTTRHVHTRQQANQPTESLSIAKNPQKPEPVIPAFTAAYQENRQRLIDFLSADYAPKDLSEGVILHEFAEAITAEYAPRTEMTVEQWKALTADLTAEKWQFNHWIAALQRKINLKYEGRKSKPIQIPDFTPPTADEGEPVKVFYRKDRQKHLVFEGRKAPKGFNCYVQNYCNQHGISLTAETEDGQRTQFFISNEERRGYEKQNAEQHQQRKARRTK